MSEVRLLTLEDVRSKNPCKSGLRTFEQILGGLGSPGIPLTREGVLAALLTNLRQHFAWAVDRGLLPIECADLSHANLSDADLSGADLSGADLSGANLSRANLSGANLSDANLSGANLSHANLWRADLSGANLSGANLSDADLSGAIGAPQ